MPRRYRKHVNPFTLGSLEPRAPLRLPAGPPPPVEIELGCGDGMFLIARAARHPKTLFVGLDIREAFLAPGRRQIDREAIDNVVLETCNLLVDLPHLFPTERIERFFINFPDPWFKRRQRHRRWLTEAALQHVFAALRPGGCVIFQSDVWEPTLEALGLLELHEGLRNEEGPFSFASGPLVSQQTSRERVCVAEGRKIWRLHFTKVPHFARSTAAR